MTLGLKYVDSENACMKLNKYADKKQWPKEMAVVLENPYYKWVFPFKSYNALKSNSSECSTTLVAQYQGYNTYDQSTG